ncbi:hypothetical protein QYQ99_12730 [Comamonas testosteroni]|uniref:hypothetical protein n=1 Tax=Comamonas testosteroni TaxID=285 RepID=UPI00265F6B00|nr:hypothetical protein [Comamonas testosteroni]WKL18339.1 hypothetical protein QYQ99_12730 [Comamonas testosteroni]WQD43569.1 hypothetical protein U0024_01705 [Comamonas testosteroni]
MSSTRIAGGAPGRAGSVGGSQPGIATAPVAAVAAQLLPQVRYQSTWPKGWMAAAVAQHVREFQVQVSKAQMTQDFLIALGRALGLLGQAARHQRKLPSEAALARMRIALQQVQELWAQRPARTLDSLDECLQWSPERVARKPFLLAGWSWETLQALSAQDKELVSFCLLGQDGAHGTWQASQTRSAGASRHALAAALAPLGMQLGPLEQPLQLSVDERCWPQVQQRFMVKGNGQRFPAGQWVAPRLQTVAEALPVAGWSVADTERAQELQLTLPVVRERVSQALAAVQAFQTGAGLSLQDQAAQTAAMQKFAIAFTSAAQVPAYDWVLAVVPAVRAISRRRVARLLQSRGVLG